MCTYNMCFLGSSIMSYEVQVGWGKTVPLPPKPFYVAPISEAEETKFVSDPHSGKNNWTCV